MTKTLTDGIYFLLGKYGFADFFGLEWCSDGELRWDTKLNFTDAGVWEGWGPTNWNPPCIKAAYVAGTSAAVVTQGPHITSLQLHGSYLECDGVQVFCHHGDAVITTTVPRPPRKRTT